jgi:hypothetical protein
MKKLGLFIFIIFASLSCGRNKMVKQLSGFMDTEIVIPDNMQANFRGADTLIRWNDAPLKMIVWYDSAGCSSCQIQRIYEWDDIISYGKDKSDIFEPVFIFSPKQSDLHSVNIALRSSRFRHHVYVDKDGDFYKSNPGIPSDKKMHTFLIDENDRVVLVGNPVNNEKLWALYKEHIENRKPATEE